MRKIFFKNKSGKTKIKPRGAPGFTLIETLIAIAIFSVSVVALMSVLGSGISDIDRAQAKISATYLAQEGIEYARNLRDNYIFYSSFTGKTWNDFTALGSAGVSYPSTVSNFTRTITMTVFPSRPDEVEISSTVSYSRAGSSLSVTFSEMLFNWTE